MLDDLPIFAVEDQLCALSVLEAKTNSPSNRLAGIGIVLVRGFYFFFLRE